MMWIKKQAPWVIGTFGILILVGLIMMDRAGSYRADRHHNIVGSVNGEEIPTDRFQLELKNYLQGEQARAGKAPEGLQLVQLREGLFNFKVQSIIMHKLFQDYQLFASLDEKMDYLAHHPQEVAQHVQRFRNYEEVPAFLADSVIDQTRYENWLAQDSTYDRYSMRELEDQLEQSVIPQIQLQQLMKSQVHRTALEEAYSVAMRENKAALKYYFVPQDSFPVAADKFKEPELKAYFEAHPDSFQFREDAARLGYIRLPIRPSHGDTALMLDFAKDLKERAMAGEKFSELATAYSNDAATAEKGGKLEGFRSRGSLEPAVAEAAFALKPGEISDPVLGQNGYHVIQVHDRKTEDTAQKVEISDILLHISAGSETTDSLTGMADQVRAAAQKQGLASAAKEAKLTYEKTPIFEKNNMSPLGGAYVSGVNSFAFSQFEAKENISEALQSDEGIYVFERDAKYPKGRSFERAKPAIAEILAKQEKKDLARKELEARRPAIAAGSAPADIGKAVLDSTRSGPVSADNWLIGFGYSSPALFQVFGQQQGTWGPILDTDMGAVMAEVTQKTSLSEQEIAQKAEAQLAQSDTYLINGLYQEWVANLPKSAKVENKMDLVFRN